MAPQRSNFVFEGGGVNDIAFIGALQILAQRDLLHCVCRVVGANMVSIKVLVFALRSDISVQRAMRVSMAIPLFFASMYVGGRDDVHVDGGRMPEVPVAVFGCLSAIDRPDAADTARLGEYVYDKTAGFLLWHLPCSPNVYHRYTRGLRIDVTKVVGISRYDEALHERECWMVAPHARVVIAAIIQVQETRHLHADDWHRVIDIDMLDVMPTDFALSDRKEAVRIETGLQGSEKYFWCFENPVEWPVNRQHDLDRRWVPSSSCCQVPVGGSSVGSGKMCRRCFV